ncbi:MAG: hypothetical protein Q7R68_03120 [Nitrospirales bacterium]|nr:hypothetical protein [Nitrospirales bacterium]
MPGTVILRLLTRKAVIPGGTCTISPVPDWTPQEKWAWQRVCEGKVADFNEAQGHGGKLDPRNPEGWPISRVLRPVFLETILLCEPFRSALTRHGVCLAGAWYKEPLDLSNANLAHILRLERSRFDASVNLLRLKTPSYISLDGSQFTGLLDMEGLQVGSDLFMQGAKFDKVFLRGAQIGDELNMDGSCFSGKLEMYGLQVRRVLFMRESATFTEVDLGGANIGDQLSMDGSIFTGKIHMDGLRVGGDLLMPKAEFTEVLLRGGKIGGQLGLNGSQFTGKLDMDSLQIGGSLLMHEGAEFAEVDLRNARIGGQLSMDGSKFTGKLEMDSLHLTGSLLMRKGAEFAEVDLRNARIGGQLSMGGSKFTGKLDMQRLQVSRDLFAGDAQVTTTETVNLIFADIGLSLDLSGSALPSLNLTGTKAHGELRLGSERHDPTRWQDGATLILRNTDVGALQDRPEAWPDTLELDGFTYARLGGFAAGTASMADRDVSWLKTWLAKQPTYSPQPYEQLARVLFEAGHEVTAKEILYIGRERERSKAKGGNWLWLNLLKAFIGYGHRIRYTGAWVLFFIAAGMLVLRFSNQGPAHGMPYGFFYSVDMLLPIIKLREIHYHVDLDGWARYYFYIHKAMGFILASFLIAGLAGLTKSKVHRSSD